MSWVRIDDCAPEHRKLLAAGAEAAWLWVCILAYCNRQKSRDGVVPDAKVPCLYPMRNAERLVRRLVDVGLLERVDGGFRVHDYHDFQPSESLRHIRAEAGRLGGKRSGESRRPGSKNEAIASSDTKQVASKNEAIASNPDPDPDPEEEIPPVSPPRGAGVFELESESGTHPVAKRSRGRAPRTLMREDWSPSAKCTAAIESEHAGLDVAAYVAEFRDYWLGVGKPMANWDATFANRVRAQVQRGIVHKPATKPRDYGSAVPWVGEVDVPSLPQDAVQPEVDSLLVGVGSFLSDAPKPRRTRGVAIGGQPAAENDSEGNVVPAMAIGGERTR